MSVALLDQEVPAPVWQPQWRSSPATFFSSFFLSLAAQGPFYEGLQHAAAARIRCNAGQVLGGQFEETVQVLRGSPPAAILGLWEWCSLAM